MLAVSPVTETLPIAKRAEAVATTQTTDPTPQPQQPATKARQSELPALQDVIDLKVTSMTWSEFQRLVGLDPSEKPKASTAELAIELAAGMGIPISPKYSFTPGWFYTPDKAFAVRQPRTKKK